MELFGIIFSIPVALIASIAYITLIKWLVGKLPRLATPLMLGGGALLAIFIIEIIFLAAIGTVRSRGAIGPVFYVLHLAVFFLGVPALANVLVLRGRGRVKTTLAVTLCTVFAFVLVLMQYSVTEALYGVDGNNGPTARTHASEMKKCQALVRGTWRGSDSSGASGPFGFFGLSGSENEIN